MAIKESVKTNWEELSISNDFMFGKIMQNQELCKELLQRILPDLKIDHIEYPELQKSIKPDVDARSVRLDVYVQDNKEHEYMTLLMRDQENVEKGREQGIWGMISALRDLDIPDSTILQKLQEKFLLTKEESQEYLSR